MILQSQQDWHPGRAHYIQITKWNYNNGGSQEIILTLELLLIAFQSLIFAEGKKKKTNKKAQTA